MIAILTRVDSVTLFLMLTPEIEEGRWLAPDARKKVEKASRMRRDATGEDNWAKYRDGADGFLRLLLFQTRSTSNWTCTPVA